MHYELIAIPDAEIPAAVEPQWQHLLDTYVSESNKTASIWRAIPAACLDFRPHKKVNTIRTILVHQLLSERRFFAQFVGTQEPAVEELLPPGELASAGRTDAATAVSAAKPQPPVTAYIDKYVWLCKLRLPQLAAGTTEWWLAPRPFFGGLTRERIWVFWRRVLHTCHHRTQVQTWLRLAGQHTPAIYGPSGDVSWSDADPTYSLAAANRPTNK